MRRLFKVPLVIIGVLYVLFIALVSIPHILGLFSRDIQSVDETGLQITNPNIQNSSNAHFDLIQLTDAMYFPDNKDDIYIINKIVTATSGDPWNDNLVKDVISKNSKTLEIMDSASGKSILYNQQYSDVTKISPDTITPPLNGWRNAAKITSLNSLDLLKRGKNIEAMEQAIKIIKVGYLVSESNQPLIGYLVGIAINGMGYNAASKIIKESNFTLEQKTKYIRQLSALVDDGQGLKNSFILEYHMRSNGLSMYKNYILYKIKAPNFMKFDSYYFKINKTKQLDADYTREQIKNISTQCDDLSNIPNVQSKELIPSISFYKIYFIENAVGKILHGVVRASLSTLYVKRCEHNTKLSTIIQLLNR